MTDGFKLPVAEAVSRSNGSTKTIWLHWVFRKYVTASSTVSLENLIDNCWSRSMLF